MEEPELNFMIKFAENTDKYNKRLYFIIIGLMVLILAQGFYSNVTIQKLNTNMTEMSVNQWSSYMTADYYYPDLSQVQEVKVNN